LLSNKTVSHSRLQVQGLHHCGLSCIGHSCQPNQSSSSIPLLGLRLSSAVSPLLPLLIVEFPQLSHINSYPAVPAASLNLFPLRRTTWYCCLPFTPGIPDLLAVHVDRFIKSIASADCIGSGCMSQCTPTPEDHLEPLPFTPGIFVPSLTWHRRPVLVGSCCRIVSACIHVGHCPFQLPRTVVISRGFSDSTDSKFIQLTLCVACCPLDWTPTDS
jgi:hypothetical protein